jgi:hypothetical protein
MQHIYRNRLCRELPGVQVGPYQEEHECCELRLPGSYPALHATTNKHSGEPCYGFAELYIPDIHMHTASADAGAGGTHTLHCPQAGTAAAWGSQV